MSASPTPEKQDAPQPPRPVQQRVPLPKVISRPKEVTNVDEEMGSELKMGEFQGVHSLSLSEAQVIVKAVFESRKKTKPHLQKENEHIAKILDYLVEFSRFKNQDITEQADRLLQTRAELHVVERSQLGSLLPETADEAKTLIPSLANKISDDDLQDLLIELNKLRSYE